MKLQNPSAPLHAASGVQHDLNGELTRYYDEMFRSDIHEEMFAGSGYSNWGYWYADTRTPQQASAQLLERLLSCAPRTGSVLDVACGGGGITAQLARTFDEVTAINVSPYQVARTRERVPTCRALQMDATRLNFPDASFDVLVCVEAAFHFRSKARFVAEARRVLRPNGWLVMSDAIFAAPPSSYALSLLPSLPPTLLPHANEWNLPAYRDFMEVIGFDVTLESAYAQAWKRFYAFEKAYCERKAVVDAARARVYRDILAKDALIDSALCDYLLVRARKL